MPKIIRLYTDMSFSEKGCKSQERKLVIEKDYTPDFEIGTSIFRERWGPIDRLKLWKRRREIAIILDGSNQAMSLKADGNKLSYDFDFGTKKETKSFVAKLVAKARADMKPISNTQFMIIMLMVGIVIVFQLMIMKGYTF